MPMLATQLPTHAADRSALHEMARSFRADHPDARVFIFFAGDPIPEGLAVSLATRGKHVIGVYPLL